MNGPRKLLAAAVFTLLMAAFSSASDIYIAQNAAGSNNGSSCANAFAKSYLDTSSNWKAGNTYHLCGTFTAAAGTSGYINVGASGTSSSPITLLFEQGAILTAPYWSGGVISLGGRSYVVIDGGTNGTIQATANGTKLSYQMDNGECVSGQGGNATNVTVQNLTCANLYVDSSPADNGGENTFGIDIWNTSSLVIRNNTLHDMKWAIRNSFQTGSTYSDPSTSIYGNNAYNMDHGVFIGDSNASGNASVTGIYIYGNTFGSMTSWDNTANNNHHDWVHLNTNSSASRFKNVYVYNNYGNGDVGANANGGFFSYPNGPSTMSNVYFFNNVYVNTSTNHCWANGFISWYLAGSLTAVNNTFVSSASSCKDNGLDYNNSSTGLVFQNNLIQNTGNSAVYASSGVSVAEMDYNAYYLSSSWFWSGSWLTSLGAWQSATGFDMHGTVSNPKLTSTFHLTDNTSSAWQSGANLYSLCTGQPNPGLGALCSDRSGTPRQSTGNWDIGAYADSASGTLPNPPTGLSAAVQ